MTWDELKTHRLVVYSTPWCSDCRRLKQHLDGHGVTYHELDIDADAAAAARLQAKTGRAAIPYVEIDGRDPVRGWHREAPGSWDETTFLRELAQALG